VDVIRELAVDVINNHSASALQYGSTEGVPALREIIAKKFHDNKVGPEQIFMSTGSQEGLDILGKVFIDPGDKIVVSAPTYLGAITAFKAYRAKFVTIEADDYGMNIEILEERLRAIYAKGDVVKFVYTIPNFHNPNGSTMSLKRRKKIVKLAEEYDLLIVEDDPYAQLRYTGEQLPRLHDLIPERTIYMSTFSKIMAPAMRLGWNVVPEEIYSKMIICKQSIDLCSSPLNQYLALKYLEGGHLEPHIERIRKVYGNKRKVMLESIEEYFPMGSHWTKPEGGMFLWATLDHRINTRKMFPRALENNVAYVIGGAFYPNGGGENTMRLNFSFSAPEIVREGIKRLGNVIEQELELMATPMPEWAELNFP
ncbi:MAG: PLP-dependent aminotransferase family protein, partial [Thermoplasmata archaeon]|nr:PLP-dependent aminotransferase family protein [Thermoplasmata archaeon]